MGTKGFKFLDVTPDRPLIIGRSFEIFIIVTSGKIS